MILHIQVLPERFIISNDAHVSYAARSRTLLSVLDTWLQKTKTSVKNVEEIILELHHPLGFGRIRHAITVVNTLGAPGDILLSFAGSKKPFSMLPTPYQSNPTITNPRASTLCT